MHQAVERLELLEVDHLLLVNAVLVEVIRRIIDAAQAHHLDGVQQRIANLAQLRGLQVLRAESECITSTFKPWRATQANAAVVPTLALILRQAGDVLRDIGVLLVLLRVGVGVLPKLFSNYRCSRRQGGGQVLSSAARLGPKQRAQTVTQKHHLVASPSRTRQPKAAKTRTVARPAVACGV